MGLHLQFRRYRLPLRTSVRTAHEVWVERTGILLRLTDEQGRCGFGEIAPIPAFGTETVEQAEAAVRSLGEWPSDEQLGNVPKTLGCVRHALAAAREQLTPNHTDDAPENTTARPDTTVETGTAVGAEQARPEARKYLPIAALLPAGRAALESVAQRAEAGFRVFKWKVGVADFADELALLDDVCAALPKGGRLRLDANGAWDRRQAERWLERCADRPIEFVEQPCFAPKSVGEAPWRRAEDLLLGLAHDFPTPIALDESLVGDADIERWLGTGWPGWFVLKPTLLGDAREVVAGLAATAANVVFSSALETGVGAQHALRIAFAWPGDAKALGFGVWPLFTDSRFDGPAATPFLYRKDVERLDPQNLWNALS